MLYTLNTVPEQRFPWQATKIEDQREKLKTRTYEEAGVLRWQTNDAPVPIDVFLDAFCTPPAAQSAACSEHTARAIAAYKQAQANRSPEQIAEERAMARAAFGAGEEVMNIITGERYVA